VVQPSPDHGRQDNECDDIDAYCDQYEDDQRDNGDQCNAAKAPRALDFHRLASRPWQAEYPAAIMTNQLERKGSVGQSMLGGPMTAAAKQAKNQQRGERAIELRVAAKLENLAVLRTLVGAVGTFEDLDFDAVADLRLAVDEVCTRLIRSAVPGATLAIVVDSRDDELVVETSTTCDNYDVVTPGSFSWHVLTSLTDDVQTFQDGSGPEGHGIFGVTLTTRRAGARR
jgi:anti-sigma regulatory factor (Ser/Thr protein kinase)